MEEVWFVKLFHLFHLLLNDAVKFDSIGLINQTDAIQPLSQTKYGEFIWQHCSVPTTPHNTIDLII